LTNTVAFSGSSGGTLDQIAAAQPSVGWTATLGARSLPGMFEKLIRSVVVSTAGRGVGLVQGVEAAGTEGMLAASRWLDEEGVQLVRNCSSAAPSSTR
jgi:hypothetical protein